MILETKGLSKRFGGLIAVNTVSVGVEQGEIRAVIGPNGSGKSTLLNLLSGVYKPSEGTVFMDGASIGGNVPSYITKAGIGRTFQNTSLFSTLTVLDNVMVGTFCRMHTNIFQAILGTRKARKEEEAAREEAYGLLELVGLRERASSLPTDLSYGQRKTLEMARALGSHPKVLMLDEPVGGLSSKETDELVRIIRELRSQGLTIIVVEHNMRFVMGLADRISVLNFGKKIAEGSPDEIRNNPEVIAAYLGEPGGGQ